MFHYRPTALPDDDLADPSMFIACTTATLLMFVMTVLPVSRSEIWWVRALDFPRLQLAVLALLLLLIELVALDSRSIGAWALYAVGGLCLAWQTWWIVPYTPIMSVEVKPAPHDSDAANSLRILTSNVLGSNRQSDKLLELVRTNSPDILVTLESNAWWQEQLDQIEEAYPHTVKCPLENLYGMHVYSRLPLSDTRIDYLVEAGIPSIHAGLTLRSGQQVSLHFLHPQPPNPQFNDESSERDAELVIVAKHVAAHDVPTVVCGDLNDVAWSSTTRLFRKLSGLLDPRVGRGMFNTFHADWWFIRWPLDHLFHSAHFTLNELRRLPSIGSDHFPLLTDLQFCPEVRGDQHGLDATADDESRASAKEAQQHVDADDVPEPGTSSSRALPV
jgi:endonuclease/exonuclease/phosphatase (EEP) superfamily protein YafD